MANKLFLSFLVMTKMKKKFVKKKKISEIFE